MTKNKLDIKSTQQAVITSSDVSVIAEIETHDRNQIKTDVKKYERFGFLVLVITFGVLGIWSSLAPLSGAIVARGSVVAASSSKEVQHLTGGIIEKIFVDEGELVHKNDPILKLNDVQERAELEIVTSQYYEIIGQIARLDAQLNKLDTVIFPQELLAQTELDQIARIIKNQTQMFKSLSETQVKKNLILKQTIEQTQKQIEGLYKRVNQEKQHIQLYDEEIKERERLYRLKLDSKVKLKEMERNRLSIVSQLSDHEAQILSLEVKISEIENQIIVENQTYINQVVTELQNAQAKKVDLKVRWLALEERLKRTLILSPETGAVVGLDLDTVGGIVKAAEIICEVVPQDKKFAIKAKVNIGDIDKIYPGQSVDIRFSAFDTRYTQVATGKTVRVSADALEDAEGNPYYDVKILLDPSGYELIKENEFEIIPGMPVETMIKIKERTFLNYLVKPFQDMLAKAFNEE